MKYAIYIKDFCTCKTRLKENEKVDIWHNVFALIQPMPQKCNDPRIFPIPCTIGDSKFENTMLYLGVSINVMPTSIFNTLYHIPLLTTGVTTQVKNRSSAHPTELL